LEPEVGVGKQGDYPKAMEERPARLLHNMER